MTLRRLWKPLTGVALLVTGSWFGASAPAAAATQGCTGDVVVALDVRIVTRPGEREYQIPLSDPLPAGSWSVSVVSADGYDGRSATRQDHEQWVVDLGPDITLGPTADLPDGVDHTEVAEELGVVETREPLDHVVVRHAWPFRAGEANSVNAVCIGFTRTAPPPTTTAPPPPTTAPPPPPTTAPPTTAPPPPPTTAPPATAPPPPATTAPPPTPSTVAPVAPAPVRLADVVRVAAAVDCVADEVVVLVGNDGSVEVIVDVAVPRSAISPGLAVGAGSVGRATVALGEIGGVAEVRVSDSATGELVVRRPIEADCGDPARPTVTTIVDCAEGVVVVRLGNDGGDPAVLRVVHERVAVGPEITVVAGTTREVDIVLGDASTVPIRVLDEQGADVSRVEVDNVCPPSAPDGDGSPPPAPPAPDPSPAPCPDDEPECARVRVIAAPDCPSRSVAVTIEREGSGRERFVVLVDGAVAGVVAIHGTNEVTVPIELEGERADLTVSRSETPRPIVVGEITCGRGRDPARPVAHSLVLLAVLASASGVVPWPRGGIRP